MKKIIVLYLLLLTSFVNAQNNVRLIPDQDTICSGTNLSIWIAGQSFYPLIYQWSTGDTTPTISITQSGTYSLTVTGYMGRSFFVRSYTFTKYYEVPSSPTINVVKGPWVCRFDNVILEAQPGYSNYVWSDGHVGTTFNRIMDSTYLSPQLDTAHIWYTANISGCSVKSDTMVLRGVRAPNGVGQFYCGRLNINPNDSIPAGLVLEYLYPNQYEMEFTQVSDPSVVITYFPPLGSRKTPANILTPGERYLVRSRVIINGQPFCWGIICEIGIRPPVMATPSFGFDPMPVEFSRTVEILPNYFITVTPEGKYIIIK